MNWKLSITFSHVIKREYERVKLHCLCVQREERKKSAVNERRGIERGKLGKQREDRKWDTLTHTYCSYRCICSFFFLHPLGWWKSCTKQMGKRSWDEDANEDNNGLSSFSNWLPCLMGNLVQTRLPEGNIFITSFLKAFSKRFAPEDVKRPRWELKSSKINPSPHSKCLI